MREAQAKKEYTQSHLNRTQESFETKEWSDPLSDQDMQLLDTLSNDLGRKEPTAERTVYL